MRSNPARTQAPAPDYPALGSTSSSSSRLIGDHSETQWSQAPDVFVEKSQLELRAEREAAQRANTKPKKAPQRDHQEFPTLGGAPKNQNTFWGVPGNSIQKSASSKKNKKKKGKNGLRSKTRFFNFF